MKKIIILFVLFLMAFNINFLKAQEIPNANFESWTSGMFSAPVGWKTMNTTMAGKYGGITTTKSSDAYSDTLAAQLKTIKVNPHGAPINFVAPGILSFGRIDVDPPLFDEMNVYGGIAITSQSKFLKGFLKFTPADSINDSALISFYSLKYSIDSIKIYQDSMISLKDSMHVYKDSIKYITFARKCNIFSLYPKDTIAMGTLYLKKSISTYKKFIIPLNYKNNIQADTMNILIMSSTFNGSGIGNVLLVDSLWMDNVTEVNSIDKPNLQTSIKVYPNPTTTHLYIENNNIKNQPTSYKLYNMIGGLVKSTSTQTNSENIYDMDVSSLTNGIYLLEYTQEGKIQHEKIIINK